MPEPLRYRLVLSPGARRGEYRVSYEIDDDQRLVRVVDVDHGRDFYRG